MKERTAFFWVLRKIRRRIPMMVVTVLTNASGALFGVLFALGTKGVIDAAVSGDMRAFWKACLVQLTIICARLLCSGLARYLRDWLVTELDRDWKRELLGGLLQGEYVQVSEFHSGELINRLNNDVRVLNEGLASALPAVCSMIVQLGAAVSVLFAMDARFTLVLCGLGVVAILASGVARRGLKRINKQVSQTEGKVLSFFQEVLERLLVVQAMDLHTEVEHRTDGLLKERLKVQRRRRRISLVANMSISVLYYSAGFAALAWCAWRLLHGAMSFGTLTVVTQLVGQIQTPFVNLSGIIPQYAAMAAAAERLMELEQIPQYPKAQMQDAKTLYENMEYIGGEGLCFAYGEEEVLRNAEFFLPKGAFAAITGASGIGKSTLLKLLLGIFKPADGVFYLQQGGERVPLPRNAKGLFSYVPQGNFLFSGSVRENLLISRPDATQQQVDEAIYVSCMEQFLSQLPDGLDTVLGENGAGLSEGQVQRLAIARAVLSGAPILLLDEATSALDMETERQVLKRIAELKKHTCIIVSHREAALRMADWRLEVANKTIKVNRAK